MHTNVTDAEVTRLKILSVVQSDAASSDSTTEQEDGSSQLIAWGKLAGGDDQVRPPSGDFRRVTHGW